MPIINLIVTEVEENCTNGYVEISTHKGTVRGIKALVVMDNEHNGNYTIGMMNLNTEEKERLFELLDTQLHEDDTRENMVEKIEILENKVSDLEETIEEAVEETACEIDYNDAEFDFYEK